MAKKLSFHEVAELAVDIAGKLNIVIPACDELLKKMSCINSLPQQFSDTNVQLWVDKYYIAYSRWNEPDVHYVYLAFSHIAEEYASYKKLNRVRKTNHKLPEAIRKQFVKALQQMRENKRKYVIFEIE